MREIKKKLVNYTEGQVYSKRKIHIRSQVFTHVMLYLRLAHFAFQLAQSVTKFVSVLKLCEKVKATRI